MIHARETWDRPLKEETRVFWEAVCLGALLHLALLVVLVFMPAPIDPPIFATLAVADLSPYDPLGGQGGVDELIAPEEEIEELSLPEPDFEPEELTFVESTAPSAEPVAITPPKPKTDSPRVRAPTAAPPTRTASANTGVGTGGAGPGGTPGGTGVGNSDELDAYKAMVRRRIEGNKKYPPAAQSRRQTGVVRVSFIINQDGQIHSANVVESSGHNILDDEVLALLRRVSPLPPLPASSGLSSLKITVPLRFSLN
ncbi:MAG: energy transducer TonB [Deltaproteobacteria bacterium]|nr:energy transducer TonB [Deltaproteobacteria bacterium]